MHDLSPDNIPATMGGSDTSYRKNRFRCINCQYNINKMCRNNVPQYRSCLLPFLPLSLLLLMLQGCGSHIYHFVEPGETLYSISWAYGHDYREVAKWNRIASPYRINRGQRLRVVAPISKAKNTLINSQHNKHNQNKALSGVRGIRKDSIQKADKNNTTRSRSKTGLRYGDLSETDLQHQRLAHAKNNKAFIWQWPTKKGKVVQTFDANDPRKKGVDVAGISGQAIYSAASGRVVYSGGGLTRYGKLIIIKHNETYLSAYAHNKRLLVSEGESLKSGQLIAEMGSTGTNKTKLHFEIRRNGTPVDPLRYLPRKMR
ncbi:MAG: peptidoglycan DD-metalloendopeptidase family protein [Gammaproteobacteria bacterium]|nr:peptidoglycan DD-metalloendopeptidase family protein [Gammaproteobacteria bacterium]